MTKDKALEIAIEWMEGLIQYLPSTKEHKATMSRYNKAITAIKESLAQPEQEPVAWVCMNYKKHDIDFDQPAIDAIPVGTMLYTHAQRTWVGLTDDEIDAIYTGVRAVHREIDSDVFARAIEAKLKEKNT